MADYDAKILDAVDGLQKSAVQAVQLLRANAIAGTVTWLELERVRNLLQATWVRFQPLAGEDLDAIVAAVRMRGVPANLNTVYAALFPAGQQLASTIATNFGASNLRFNDANGGTDVPSYSAAECAVLIPAIDDFLTAAP